jgi:hypothetical protein
VELHLAAIRRPQDEASREPWLDLGSVPEAEFGKRVLGAAAVVACDRQVQVLVGTRLLSEERIDAPAAIEPDRDAGGVEAVQRLDHLRGVQLGASGVKPGPRLAISTTCPSGSLR